MPQFTLNAEEYSVYIRNFFLELTAPMEKMPCGACHGEMENYLLRTAPNGQRYCRTCMQQQFIACRGCSSIVERVNGRRYCEACEVGMEPCHHCGVRVHERDYQSFRDINGIEHHCCSETCLNHYIGYCDACGGRHLLPFEANRCPVKYPPLPTDYKDCYLPNRVWGVELETTIRDNAPPGWTSVHDGSISGLEYLSGPILGGIGIDIIEKGCKLLSKGGIERVDNACGYHLHMNARDLSEKQIANFLRTAYMYQDSIFSMVHATRRSNRYAIKLPSQFKNVDEASLESVIYPVTGSDDDRAYQISRFKREKYNSARYSWLNTHSYYYRGTMEVRLHDGTTNAEKVLNWAELWLKVLEFTATSTYNERLYAEKNWFEFLDEIGVRNTTIDFYRKRVAALA